jgi:hypothetical protein
MTNENDGNAPPPSPQSDPPRQSPVIPPTPTQGEISPDPNDKSNNQQETAKELAREFRWVEVTSLIINGALAVIGIVALCIYHGQLTAMQGQLDQMGKQSTEIQKQTTLMRQQLVGSQGAIVSLNGEFITATPDELATNFTISVGLKNTGHIIANKVDMRLNVQVFDFSTNRLVGRIWPCHFEIFALAPTDPPRTPPAAYRLCHIDQFSSTDSKLIDNFKRTVAIDGILTYDNGFGEVREEPMCYRYTPKINTGVKYGIDGDDHFYECSQFQAIRDRILAHIEEK